MNPAIITAIVAAVVSLVSGLVASSITFKNSAEKHAREYKPDYQVEEIVLKFLNHPKWQFRTFRTIKYHMAGFEDNELRQISLCVGALRFEDSEGIEI